MGMSLHKGPVSKNDLRNGEERLQYHRGRLKLIRKEFGKLFELEFSSQEQKELKVFAKHSDVRAPQRSAVKIIKEGVKVAADDKNLYASLPVSTDTIAAPGDAVDSSGNIIKKV